MKKERSLAERFCATANQFLKDYRACGGKISPADMLSWDFWNRDGATHWSLIVENKVIQGAWRDDGTIIRRSFLVKRANRITWMLFPRTGSLKNDVVTFSDGSKARVIFLPSIFSRRVWYWGCKP